MNNELAFLLTKGIDQHRELLEELEPLDVIGGEESFSDVKDWALPKLQSFAHNLYSGSSWAAGTAYKSVSAAFIHSTRFLITRYGSNKMALAVVDRDLTHDRFKTDLMLSSNLVAGLTSEGNINTVSDDMKTLLS